MREVGAGSGFGREGVKLRANLSGERVWSLSLFVKGLSSPHPTPPPLHDICVLPRQTTMPCLSLVSQVLLEQ